MRIIKRKLKGLIPLLMICFLFMSFSIEAQKKVTGKVTDIDGIPLPGVSVLIQGTIKGTSTDLDGNFSIAASKGDILSFSIIGFKSVKKTIVNPSEKIVVTLKEEGELLDEVIVVGYGTLTKKESTGSQVSLKASDINKVQAVSFEEALQGQAAGVQITASGGPGEAARIQIRGLTSINASSAPLYVIDGVEIDGDALGISNGINTTETSPLSLIDPATIKSIDILKDASATAVYGSRGANGVVIIQTKNGKSEAGKAVVELDVTTGMQKIARQIDLLTPQEYVDRWNDAFPFNPDDASTLFSQRAFRDNAGNPIPLDSKYPDGTPVFPTRDFRGEVFRQALIRKYNLSIRKGGSDSWFNGSLGYTNQEGVVINSDFKRIQAAVNVGANVDRFRFGFQANGGRNDRSGIVNASPNANGQGQSFGVITNLTLAPPIQPRFDELRNGNGAITNIIRDETGFVTQIGEQVLINPVTQATQTQNNSFEVFGYASASMEYKITDDLKFRSDLSVNHYESQSRVYFPGSFGYGQFIGGGLATVNTYTQNRWQNNNTLTFDKEFAEKHKLNVVLGQSVLSNEAFIISTSGRDFESDLVNLDDINAAQVVLTNTNRVENGLLGVFGRINYSFDKRYVVTFSARGDKSSRFAEGSKWGFFPAVGFSWNASEESFLENVSFLSDLRFRGSWGKTGNDKIGVFQSGLTFGSERFAAFRTGFQTVNAAGVIDGNRNNAFFLTRVANPNLTWETTTTYDAGVELGLFKNRISFSGSWFRKDTEDLLLERQVSGQSGFTTVLENIGEIQNRGVEISLRTVNIDTKDFSWKTNFNISFIENEVIDLGSLGTQFPQSSSVGRQVNNDFIVREGEPIGSYYGYVSDGVYTYDDFVEFDGLTDAEAAKLYSYDPTTGNLRQNGGDNNTSSFTLKDGVPKYANISSYRPGMQKVADLNGDGIIDENNDLTVLGNAIPDHFGGITNTFRYKAFDFSFQMNWKYGNEIYNKNFFPAISKSNQVRNRYGVSRERWTPENTDTRQHSVFGRVLNGGIATVSDYIEDGSFLRLQNITFGYNMPSKFTEKLGLASLRLYTAADNLYVWTNYSGYDPDVSVSRGVNGALTQGVDFDAYPRARTFRFGIKAKF